MKDIPMFTTENGVATLFLREIPYRGIARIKLLATQTPEALLEECVAFCRACGAEQIHATGHAVLEAYPFVTSIWEMNGEPDRESDAMVFPMTEETAGKWRAIANERLNGVDNAATITAADCKEMIAQGSAYFVHRNGDLLGLGKIGEETIELIVSVKTGAGETVLRSLAALVPSERISLTVASTNKRAIRLYERMGFVTVKELSKWYKII